MCNFTWLYKKGRFAAVVLVFASVSAFGQVRDTSQYSTDTTTVAVKESIKGEKFSGKVVDANNGTPINGANVSIPNFSATITNDKGEFKITIPDYQATIEVSYKGYHTKLVPIVKSSNQVIRLYYESYPSVFAPVVTATGSKSNSRTVGALAVQNGRDWGSNSETLASIMQGRLSGVNVIRRSGTPGIGAEVFNRGFTSLYGTNQPLYVVDGMIYDSGIYGSSITNGHTYNPLQNIDPRDIVNITVAKDAVQTAAYGSRAANGVVFITTSRAKELETQIDFAAYTGVNFRPETYPVMNADQERTYLADILGSQGLSPAQIGSLSYMSNTPAGNPGYYAGHNNTDWQKQTFKNTIDQNYYLSITGGDNVAKYSLSLGYLKDQGLVDTTNYARYGVRFNADLNLTQKLSGQVRMGFTYNLQNLRDQGLSSFTNPIFLSLVKAPFFSPNQISATGAVSPKLSDTDLLGVGNPVALIKNGVNTKKAYRFSGLANFDYQFNKQWKLSALLGLTYDKDQESSFVPRLGVSDEIVNLMDIDSRSGTETMRLAGSAVDTRLSYTNTFAKLHKLTTALGFRYNNTESELDQVRGYNTGTDQLVSIGNTDNTSRVFSGRIGEWRTLNTYLTSEYGFADKYFVNAAISADGSSRFGKDIENAPKFNGNRYAIFPSIGAAWLISSEDFLKGNEHLNLLKLRASYGLVGNDDIGNYRTRRTYVSQNLIGLQGLVRGTLPNSALQWEVVKKLNAGVDASLFDERIGLSVDFWNNKTDKMITQQAIDLVVAGVNSYAANNASMKTSGVDLSLTGRVLNGPVKWDAGLTLGRYRNKVLSLASGTIISSYAGGSYITMVGQAANKFYGVKSAGVYTTQAEATAAGLNIRLDNGSLVPFSAGDMRFVDLNGDKVIDNNDRQIIGDPNPDFFGGFSNTFSYKKWKLDALITFSQGGDIYNYTRSQLESGSGYYNQTQALLNRWRADGQQTSIPKATYGDPMGNSRFSDRWIEDGSYARLRSVTVSYSLPFVGKAFKYLNVYATGNNLFTLTGYKGFDPEFSASESIFTQGVDTTLEPQFRSVQLGVRLGL